MKKMKRNLRMSDLFSLVVNATVTDAVTGEIIGDVDSVETDGKNMRIKIIILDIEDEDYPDDGEKEEIPEDPKEILKLVANSGV